MREPTAGAERLSTFSDAVIVPFATAWIARTGFAAIPVAAYAGLFVCVNVAYVLFERTVFAQADPAAFPERARRLAKRRSFSTLAIFAVASATALFVPAAGFVLVCCALILYLRPEAPALHQR